MAQVRRMSADLERQAQEIAAQVGEHARAAAKSARMAAVDFRDSYHSRPENRTLVLPSGAPRPELFPSAHEDLAVMSRILTRALERESRHPRLTGMAFDFSDAHNRALDATYLEGYGALFFLNADFPLTAPPATDPTKLVAKDEDSTWERTKRELRGREGDGNEESLFDVFNGADESPRFDAEKVNGLRRRLVESLKHAKNLRNVQDSETVTVVVFGKSTGKRTVVTQLKAPRKGRHNADASLRETRSDDISDDPLTTGTATTETKVSSSAAESGGTSGSTATIVSANVVGYVNTDSIRQTTLVLRAKKSDIDAFATGKLNSDEFTQRVSASAY